MFSLPVNLYFTVLLFLAHRQLSRSNRGLVPARLFKILGASPGFADHCTLKIVSGDRAESGTNAPEELLIGATL